jgi:hypothetical protein
MRGAASAIHVVPYRPQQRLVGTKEHAAKVPAALEKGAGAVVGYKPEHTNHDFHICSPQGANTQRAAAGALCSLLNIGAYAVGLHSVGRRS